MGVNDFRLGDRIIEFDTISIEDLSLKYKDSFYSNLKERQNWRPLLNKFKNCTVIRDESALVINLESFNTSSLANKCNISDINGIPLITLPDFNDENLIKELISANRDTLNKAKNIIIDVRNNIGGSDLAYFPVIEYLFESNTSYNSLFVDESMEVLYSKQNCDLRIEMFSEILKNPEIPDYVKEIILIEIDKYKTNYGLGFVEEPNDDDYTIVGKGSHKKIYVLTDMDCGSSGDSFVRLAKKSPITTVIGRNTKGVLDYSNCAFYTLDDRFEFMYPTSRMFKNNKILGIDNIGVEPDIVIEWTPDHIFEDIDLEKTLKLIEE